MPDQSRRDFMKKSVVFVLGSGAAESALLLPAVQTNSDSFQGASTEFFLGFKREQIKARGATINLVYGGKGSPVLLLHGHPQTHLEWRKIAPLLSQDFFLVIPDLRGYGDSGKPPEGENHAGYSKRAMAQDQVEVMEHLGFQKFAVVGHDRGGRVGHRMALDYQDRVTKLAVLDIVPTYKLYQNVTREFATAYFHWFFLIQPSPFPETLIANSVEFYLRYMLFGRGGDAHGEPIPGWMGEAAFKEYLRCFGAPAAIHATCEDYRAAASIDLIHDEADQGRRIQCPLLVLWAEKGAMHRMYNVLDTWRDRANDVRGNALPAGHFFPEQIPQELARELKPFLNA